MNLTVGETRDIERTGAEWTKVCLDIEGRRNGVYPPDWYAKVIMSGLMRRVLAVAGLSEEISILLRAVRGSR